MSVQTSDQYGPAPASTQASPGQAQPAARQPAAIPFVRASRRATIQDFSVSGQTLRTTMTQLGPFDIQSVGFLRFLEVFVTQTTAGNSANVAFQQEGPFNVLQNI